MAFWSDLVSRVWGGTKNEKMEKRESVRASGMLDASTSDINERRAPAVDAFSDELYNPRERSRARADCRQLYTNNPSAFHMAFSEMLSVMGVPPNLQFRTGDSTLDADMEQGFKAWAEASDFWATVAMMILALPYDGEGFALIKGWGTDKMRVVGIEPKRISSPPRAIHDPNTLDGIEYNQDEEPSGYWVERRHINPNVTCPLQWDRYPAFEVLHLFIPFFPEQHRGYPLFDSAKNSLSSVEDLRQELIEAARTNARIHGVISSEMPFQDGDEEERPESMDVVKMPRKGLLTLGNNLKVQQLKNEAMACDFAAFMNANITVAGAGSMLPRNIATNDSSQYNFSSARLDHLIFSRWSNYLRRHLRKILNRVVNLWIATNWNDATVRTALYLCGGVEAIPREWFFEELELDEKTKTDVAIALVTNKLETLKHYYATKNRDWDAELTQIAEEQARLRELGLALDETGPGAVSADGSGVSTVDSPGVPGTPPTPPPEAPPPAKIPALRSAQQLAATIGVSASRISGWRRAGLRSYRLGSRVLYDPADVQAFIESGTSQEQTK